MQLYYFIEKRSNKMNTKKKTTDTKVGKAVSKKKVSGSVAPKGQEVKREGTRSIWLSALIIILGVFIYYYFEGVNSLYAFGALLIGLVGGVALFFTTAKGKQLIVFFKEARIELRRVVWPTMDETRKMTLLVVIVMAITLLFLMLVDFIIKNIISLILSFS